MVLITGSLDWTIQYLLGVPRRRSFIANRLEMKDGKATGKLLRPVVAGPEKAGLMVDDAREVGHDLAQCSAYSDSYSDVPMLSIVGHPACINPDAKLARLARAYDWPILDIESPPRGTMESVRCASTIAAESHSTPGPCLGCSSPGLSWERSTFLQGRG